MANPKIPAGYQGTYAKAADGSPVLVMVSKSESIADNKEKKTMSEEKQKICTVHHRTEKGIRKAIHPERNQVLSQRATERIRAYGEYRQAKFLFHLRQSEKERSGSTARRTAQTGGKEIDERQTVIQCRERARAFAPFLFSG